MAVFSWLFAENFNSLDLNTSSCDSHCVMLIAKYATDMLTSEEGENCWVQHSIFLFVSFIPIIIMKVKTYSLFFQASLQFLSLSLLNGMVLMPLRVHAMTLTRSKVRVQNVILSCFQFPARKATCYKM